MRLDKNFVYFTRLCFRYLFLRHYAYMLCNVSLNTPIACSLVCFPGMTSSLVKVIKSSGAHFMALFLKFPNFLMFLNIQIDVLILKTYYGQFTLTSKKSLHIIFMFILITDSNMQLSVRMAMFTPQ